MNYKKIRIYLVYEVSLLWRTFKELYKNERRLSWSSSYKCYKFFGTWKEGYVEELKEKMMRCPYSGLAEPYAIPEGRQSEKLFLDLWICLIYMNPNMYIWNIKRNLCIRIFLETSWLILQWWYGLIEGFS